MSETLPEELTFGADERNGEYAWSLSSFQAALIAAPDMGYACLGGQFQLRPDSVAIYEFYWLEANASERLPSEPWSEYAGRSCREVSERFASLLGTVNFREEATKFGSSHGLAGSKPLAEFIVFNAYFVDESEFERLQQAGGEL